MQTFLPYASFRESAKCLDDRRLGKQRVEVVQILNALAGLSDGWKNHPATLMWKGYELALVSYGIATCNEWLSRPKKDGGIRKDSCYQLISDIMWDVFVFEKYKNPLWLGDNRFHSSHRAALLFKNSEHYGKFGWVEEPKKEYFWPTKEGY